jgi:uncharacterized protein with NRDE domain
MCLVALAIDANRRFPLVLAANRDESFDRPAARLAWWTPEVGGPPILGGRDLQAGGTWLGLTAAGRLALVTNVRRPSTPDPEAPSRGSLVPLWLRTDQRPDQYWMGAALGGYAPFNLIAADFRRGDCFWASNEATAPRRLERGIFGLSNAALDTPWPKVTTLKARMTATLEDAESVDTIATRLFEALADSGQAPDADLPMTGIGLDKERLLSPAFIRTPDGGYGTRCSTVIVAERANKRLVTHVLERTWSPTSGLALLRRATLSDWPPRYADRPPTRVEDAEVTDAELGQPGGLAASATLARRTRIRTLIKPIAKS